MTEQTLPARLPGHDALVERLPTAFRIQSIARLPFDARDTLNRACLFHESAALTVEWLSRQVDPGLVAGALVAIRWQGRPVSLNGAIRVSRIVPLERPDPAVNLFETVPSAWVADRELVRRAAFLWSCLPQGLGHLFNGVFWQADRFWRFLCGPSSLAGHHACRHGNFRHSVEVADQALDLATREPRVHLGVLVMAALLHDAGKADEYQQGRSRMELSDRGRLIGHRQTVLEWLAAARAQHRVILPEAHYLALVHALTCAKGAPAWLGLREPQSPEAMLLSAADRLSGQRELMARHAPREGGFGRHHPHLGGRPFMVASQP